MWAIILAATLTQSPDEGREVVVIPVIHADVVTAELAGRLERLIRTAVSDAGVPLIHDSRLPGQDPAACETNRTCVALIGRALGSFAVVRVEGAVVGKEIAVLVQALESLGGKQIGEASFVIPIADVDREVPLRVAPLIQKLRALLPGPKKIVIAQTPALLPREETPGSPIKLTLAPVVAERGSMAPVWITGAGAVVFAGTSAGLFAMGASARACLNGPPIGTTPTVCVPQSQATRMAQRADIGATTGTIAAGIAVGLVATTIVEWLILRD